MRIYRDCLLKLMVGIISNVRTSTISVIILTYNSNLIAVSEIN